MIKVKLSTTNPAFPIIRQTLNGKGVWGNYIFFINQEIGDCDYWIVCDGINQTEVSNCKRSILITGEPPSVKKYSNNFVQQFDSIITCHNNIKHNHILKRQQSLPWMAGLKYLINENRWDNKNYLGYEYFLEKNEFIKNKEISIIVSNKSFTEGHSQRVKFVNRLIERFGTKIDVFGRGYKDIEDKYDGLAEYKYSIVLENCSIVDYWTEKISDAFLCNTFPIYYGCLNIFDYFPCGSLVSVDISNVEESLNSIERVLESQLYETSSSQLRSARELVLNKWNLFPFIINTIEELEKGRLFEKRKIKIHPERRFRKELKSLIHKILNS